MFHTNVTFSKKPPQVTLLGSPVPSWLQKVPWISYLMAPPGGFRHCSPAVRPGGWWPQVAAIKHFSWAVLSNLTIFPIHHLV